MGRGVRGRRGGKRYLRSHVMAVGGEKGGWAGWRTKAMTLGDHSSSRSLAPPLTHSVIPLLARRWSGIRTVMHEWGGGRRRRKARRASTREKRWREGILTFPPRLKEKNFEYKREVEGNYLSADSRLYLDTEDTRKFERLWQCLSYNRTKNTLSPLETRKYCPISNPFPRKTGHIQVPSESQR